MRTAILMGALIIATAIHPQPFDNPQTVVASIYGLALTIFIIMDIAEFVTRKK